MEPIIHLVKFCYDECSVRWSGEKLPLTGLDHRISMDYKTWASHENKGVFKLLLIIRIEPSEEKASGYIMECRINGIFTFPEHTPPAKIPGILRMNGNAILYGILRGQIASITGNFEAGAFLLPSINLKEAIEKIETEKKIELGKMKKVGSKCTPSGSK